MSDGGGTGIHILPIVLRCFSQEKGLWVRKGLHGTAT